MACSLCVLIRKRPIRSPRLSGWRASGSRRRYGDHADGSHRHNLPSYRQPKKIPGGSLTPPPPSGFFQGPITRGGSRGPIPPPAFPPPPRRRVSQRSLFLPAGARTNTPTQHLPPTLFFFSYGPFSPPPVPFPAAVLLQRHGCCRHFPPHRLYPSHNAFLLHDRAKFPPPTLRFSRSQLSVRHGPLTRYTRAAGLCFPPPNPYFPGFRLSPPLQPSPQYISPTSLSFPPPVPPQTLPSPSPPSSPPPTPSPPRPELTFTHSPPSPPPPRTPPPSPAPLPPRRPPYYLPASAAPPPPSRPSP